ncbi:MAG: hypothetical protein ABJP83_12160 [Roseibium sp.]
MAGKPNQPGRAAAGQQETQKPQRANPEDTVPGTPGTTEETSSTKDHESAKQKTKHSMSDQSRSATEQQKTSKDSEKGTTRTSPGDPASDTMTQFLESCLEASTLQTDYQSLYRSLPTVFGIASEILKRKEAGDAALDEGVQAVERILGDARDKAEKLSKAMIAQQDALDRLLKNRDSLTDLLKASQQKVKAQTAGFPNLSPAVATLADPNIAYQLNTLMGNLNSMVSREVERQLGALRGQAEQAQQQSQRSR